MQSSFKRAHNFTMPVNDHIEKCLQPEVTSDGRSSLKSRQAFLDKELNQDFPPQMGTRNQKNTFSNDDRV